MAVVALLLGIGIVMVYTSSTAIAEADFGNRYYFLVRQAIWVGIGLGAMAFFASVNPWFWQKHSRTALLVAVALLLLVLIPGVGIARLGARRWLGYGQLAFQPSEVAKFAYIMWLATFLARSARGATDFVRGFLPPVAVMGLLFGLIMLQPDLGTSLTLAGTGVLMLFAAGAHLAHLAGLGVVGAAGVFALARIDEERWSRITAFLNPWADPTDSGYQIIQALLAFGSGGLFGVGLGESRQKYFYLPERHTDMIYAVLGEELGFIGAALVLLLFLAFAWRGYRIAIQAPDRFSSLLAAGVTSLITLQAALNIAVVTASIPSTGIPLPFLSYGGTSLLITLSGVGILLGVSRYCQS
ncbi:MAG: stage V sporulation protein E [Symbiobacterium thermophilum]|uniref:Stage V sporulation protein E n=1 Tax=Symbiobacterium thermophilum TaxID=2734 RepID=A0A1Y2T5C8_SYMTR|nr:MAG: stage V sporulation protein E [Symbiobacterium thermophilum]PZN70825.1 MAG: putative lipid II flippase FtsW [Bacillota bacterium]